MNNDLNNNHGSMDSNKYIANRRYPHENKFYQESYIKDKRILDMQSKGDRANYFDYDKDKRPSNQKDLYTSKGISSFPTNYAAGPNLYNDDIIKGYYVNVKEEDGINNKYNIPLNENEEEFDEDEQRNNYYRQNIKNGGEEIDDEEGNAGEDEEEVENGNEYNEDSQQKYNEYIGDGIVRNNIPNYSPNQNGQNILYYRKNLGKYNPNYAPEIEYQNPDEEYVIESPAKNFNINNYNMQPYKRRHILGNLADSASSEAYAKKNIQVSPYTDNNSRIYVKPKTKYNYMNNGISTEERGIESKKESPNNVAHNGAYLRKPFHYPDYEENEISKYNKINNYDEDSINVVEPPMYTNTNNDRNKGGKVDLNTFAIKKNRAKKKEEEEEEDEDEVEDEDMKTKDINATKIQSFWRAFSTRRIMKLYHDLDEFIYLLSKVHFNHYSDNFYFFINQLYNVYKANTLDNNQIDSLEEEKEENEDENENEDEKMDENNPNNKNYDELLNDYHDLQKRYNNLVKNKFNKSSTKKSFNNDIVSVPGETTIGTIKTDNKKLKFKHQNNSTNNINNQENLTFSNDYNDEVEVNNKEYERHFYTPNQEDEDSFNENSKDKRFSYSSIHSEENSKYFDNEQPKGATSSKRNIGLKSRGKNKTGSLSLSKKNDKLLSYSPSLENEKQSRENSRKKNLNNESMNENRINNIAVIMPKHEEEFGIIKNIEDNRAKPEEIEEKLYGKYINNFSKDLFIVKNNKINLKNEEELKAKLYCFDNESIYPENENMLELKAPKKSDEKKMNDIIRDQKLFKKLKNKIFKDNNEKLITNNEASFAIENKPINILEQINNEIDRTINNLEIIQNNHRNFNPSKLDFESNELNLGQPQSLKQKKKLKKIVPTFEKELNILNIPVDKLKVFSIEKTLPTFNINEEKNAFTINNNIAKAEQKPTSFNKENMIIDNIFNNEIHMEEPKIVIKEEKPIEKEKIEKEILYLPMKDNRFKRLRRSKRTKETYFSIKPDINKKIENILPKETKEKEKQAPSKELTKTNENNFVIKNEYYYLETNDNQIPEIIEKQIKESIIINKPSKELNSFTDKKVIFSNETNFYIEAGKNEIKDINEENQDKFEEKKNKLRDRNKKDIKTINKNDEFIISGEKKLWEDLNPIAIDEFSYRNENESENDMEENINDENEGFHDNQNIYSDGNLNYGNMDIIPNEQFEIIKDKNEPKELFESKQNAIKLDGMNISKEDKELQIDIKQFNITTKKVIKKEQILSRKKFIHNKISSSDSFSMQGIPNENIIYAHKDTDNEDNEEPKEVIKYIENKKELILVEEKIDEFSYKNIKINTKENETETKPLNNFDEIIPVLIDEFNIKNKKIKMKEEETEITDELNNNIKNNYNKNEIILENIRSENIMIKAKKKKMKESETEMDVEFNNMQSIQKVKKMVEESTEAKEENKYIIKSDNFDIFAPENELNKIDKKQIILEESKIDEINLESRKRKFPKLDINNFYYETFDGKEKEKMEFQQIKNESIMFEANEDNNELLEKEKEKYKEYIIENNQMSIITEGKNKEDENIVSKTNEEELLRIFHNLNINKSEEYKIFGKEKEEKEKKEEKKKSKIKMKESEAQVDDDLINDIQESSNLILDEDELKDEQKEEKSKKLRGRRDKNERINVIESYQLAIEGVEKEKVELEEEKIEQVNYESMKKNKEKNIIFSNLDINKCDEQILYGKVKEKELLESIKNDNIIINGKEREALENIQKDSILINGKEREALENIQKDSIFINGKERDALKNIQKDSILINGKEREALENIQKDSILINGKEKEALENIQKDSILINGKEKEKIILENITNEPIVLYGKEKINRTILFENVKNESIVIKPNKRKGTEVGTQIDNDLNSNLVDKNNEAFTLESIKPIKKKSNLEVGEQQSINIKEKEQKREFNKDDISVCFSENFEIKLKEDYEIEEEKALQKSKETPQLNKNILNILEESIEKRLEIIGKPSLSKIDNNNNSNNKVKESKLNEEDFSIEEMNEIEPNLRKQFINNIVHDKLEKEKKKAMDQTKNKLIQVCRAIKLKNALGKNLKLKKDFINKLKEIKKNKDKKILCSVNAINHNYLSKNINKVEESTGTDNLDNIYEKFNNAPLEIVKNKEMSIVINGKDKKMKLERIDLDEETSNHFTILRNKKKKSNDIETEITDELNKIELVQNDQFSLLTLPKENIQNKKSKKVKRHKKNISMQMPSIESFMEIKESDLNISGIDKDTSDKEVQIEPVKEFKITTKKIVKKEILTKKKFLDVKSDNIDSFSIIYENRKEEKDKDKLKSVSKKIDTITVGTQTPKLRPPSKAAQKVVFHEIKTIIKKEQNQEAKTIRKKEQKLFNKLEIVHISNFKLIANKKVSKPIKEKINEEIEENEENKNIDIYKIELLKKFFKTFFNKRYEILKRLYWIKWKNLSNKKDDKQNKIKKLFMKYPSVFAMKLLESLDKIIKIKGANMALKNIINKRTFKSLKKINPTNNFDKKYHNKEQFNKKRQIAFNKISSILKKYAGKYVFSLHKRK